MARETIEHRKACECDACLDAEWRRHEHLSAAWQADGVRGYMHALWWEVVWVTRLDALVAWLERKLS